MDSNTKYIVAIGNPIIDISATVTEEMIQKFGLDWGKTVFTNDSNVGFFDVIEDQVDCKYIAGGSVTNSIRVANVITIITISGCLTRTLTTDVCY
jgi:adenosine kinase